MPELPEVETVRRSLEALVVGKTIGNVEVRLPRLIRTPDDVERFRAQLAGCCIEAVERRGKYLIFRVPPYRLISHLRMEGQYRLHQAGEPERPHTHIIFHFTDGTELRYRDVRQFGTMDLIAEGDALPKGVASLGPEPFADDLDGATLYRRIHRRRAPIKAVLLDQTCLAGLGNIYVDEALFLARIHPERLAAKVTRRQANELLTAIRAVLRRAIDAGGSSVSTYVDGYGRHGGFQMELNVYAREGEPCRVCQTPIEKTRVGGRGTHYCPLCQRPPRTSRRPSTARGKRRTATSGLDNGSDTRLTAHEQNSQLPVDDNPAGQGVGA
ncbi:DNA-formamidopyrimidine glycosylase [Alicyclobacillus shizuokensis]|uniref:DNA-formamidopyrimidine glycosylase n=1 Tax=Alicyclobacillus shizuokensis TaxID=392014 RepID=UPI0009F9368F|nr:DNA-formamidopyrimidine glycosylase [Alicyclobacillus shizuokensis]